MSGAMPGRAARPLSGSMSRSEGIALAVAAWLAIAAPLAAEAPQRVVSMNLCTDQLAMLVAAEGQIVSVSYLAQDPGASAMAAQAGGLLPNRGRAEEIFLMRPDLVITGPYSNPTAADMLRRLGVAVLVVDPVSRLDEIPDRLAVIGAALGQADRAAKVAADFEAGLGALVDTGPERPRAALYGANGYSAGDRTLAGQILWAAGFDNIATEQGMPDGGILPLELLALSQPDMIVTSRAEPGASRSEEILDHPVVAALRDGAIPGRMRDSDWVCGTPHVLGAIADLRGAREEAGR